LPINTVSVNGPATSKEELVAGCDVVIVGVPHSAYKTLQVPAHVEVIDLWGVLPKAAEV